MLSPESVETSNNYSSRRYRRSGILPTVIRDGEISDFYARTEHQCALDSGHSSRCYPRLLVFRLYFKSTASCIGTLFGAIHRQIGSLYNGLG